MDPLSALSIAAAIVQFVDFSTKAIAKGRELYKNGTAKEDDFTKELASKLEKLSGRLKAIDTLQVSADEVELSSLAKMCESKASELAALMRDLSLQERKRGMVRKLLAFGKAVKRYTVQERLNTMRQELDQIKSQVGLHMLSIIRQSQSNVNRAMLDLEKKTENVRVDQNHHKDAIITQIIRAMEQQTSSFRSIIEALNETATGLNENMLILSRLEFPELPGREHNIRETHEQTYEWIFDPQETDFANWLAQDSGIFWISGKAGSGKSTLMKYLDHNPETEILLQAWTAGQPCITASFYFWQAGSILQKSQEGLLRGLLTQIFRQRPDFITHCFRMQRALDHRSWSRKELTEALRHILSQNSVKVLIFIDGLDEFAPSEVEGDHFDLVDAISQLAISPSVKLCVSSRPWIQFKDAYSKRKHLILQDHTRKDMDHFVRDSLHKNERFVELARQEPLAQKFVQEILNKAEGVFLWVVLVVRSLLRGLGMHDDISTLLRRLRALPSELEPFFQRMLDNVDETYHVYAACLLRLVSLGAKSFVIPLLAVDYIPLELEKPGAVFQLPLEAGGAQCSIVPKAEARLDAWCPDLLQIQRDHHLEKLEVVHRTVLDFLNLENTAKFLQERSTAVTKSSVVLLLEVHLYSFKRSHGASDIDSVCSGCVEEIFQTANIFELEYEQPATVILQEVDRICKSVFESDQVQSSERRWPAALWTSSYARDLDDLAIVFDLTLYVDAEVSVCNARQLQFCLSSLHRVLPPLRSTAMVSLVLSKGADPNESIDLFDKRRDKISPWQAMLWDLDNLDSGNPRLWLGAIAMLEHGADLYATVLTNGKEWTASSYLISLHEKRKQLDRNCSELDKLIDTVRQRLAESAAEQEHSTFDSNTNGEL